MSYFCTPNLGTTRGLKVMATGLDPKPAIVKGIMSWLILVMSRSSRLWMSMMMEAIEPMLSVDFLKPGWFLMAEAQVRLVMVR
jgi:hypothetical protein